MLPRKNPYGVSLLTIYRLTTQTLISEPKVWGPFFILLLLHLGALTLIYLAPRVPFNTVLGPPISRFFGEIYLHYPAHLLIIPNLSAKAQGIITMTAGPLFIGTAVAMAGTAYRDKRILFWQSLKTALFRYIQLLFIYSVIFASSHLVSRNLSTFINSYFLAGHEQLLSFDAAWWQGPFLAVSSFGVFLITQALLIYSIPMIVIDNVKLFPAIVKSISLTLRMAAKTLFLVVMPMCFYLPIFILLLHTPVIVNKFFPDAVFGICVAGSILIWLLVDPLIHISTSFAYLEARQQS